MNCPKGLGLGGSKGCTQGVGLGPAQVERQAGRARVSHRGPIPPLRLRLSSGEAAPLPACGGTGNVTS